ncbi:MAG: LysM peptidoglycan-binding domain-containing protein [Bacteroidota bacterium]
MSAASRLLCACLLMALAAPVQAQTLAENIEDARTAARAEVALAQDEALRQFTFRTSAEDGVLTVFGVVATPAQRDRVAEVVRAVEGVAEVVSNVQSTGAAGRVSQPDTAADAAPKAAPTPEPAPAAEAVYHTVRSGDTLGAIARRYGVTVRQVQQLNGLRGTRIRAGQRLQVK